MKFLRRLLDRLLDAVPAGDPYSCCRGWLTHCTMAYREPSRRHTIWVHRLLRLRLDVWWRRRRSGKFKTFVIPKIATPFPDLNVKELVEVQPMTGWQAEFLALSGGSLKDDLVREIAAEEAGRRQYVGARIVGGTLESFSFLGKKAKNGSAE